MPSDVQIVQEPQADLPLITGYLNVIGYQQSIIYDIIQWHFLVPLDLIS